MIASVVFITRCPVKPSLDAAPIKMIMSFPSLLSSLLSNCGAISLRSGKKILDHSFFFLRSYYYYYIIINIIIIIVTYLSGNTLQQSQNPLPSKIFFKMGSRQLEERVENQTVDGRYGEEESKLKEERNVCFVHRKKGQCAWLIAFDNIVGLAAAIVCVLLSHHLKESRPLVVYLLSIMTFSSKAHICNLSESHKIIYTPV